MRRIISIMAAALFCAGVAWSSDYQDMQNWLFDSYTNGLDEKTNTVEYYQQKDAFYAFMTEVQNKVKTEFPVDPRITQQINTLKTECEVQKAQKLQELGVANEQALFTKLIQKYPDKGDLYASPEWLSYASIGDGLNQSIAALMKDYDAEFQKRYQAAFIDAVKKLQENSATMK